MPVRKTENNDPPCNSDRDPNRPIPANIQICQENNELFQIRNTESVVSSEIATHSLEYAPGTSDMASSESVNKDRTSKANENFTRPLLLISAPPSVVIPATHSSRGPTIQSPIASLRLRQKGNVPDSLFIQALSRLSEDKSLSISVLNNMMAQSQYTSFGQNVKRNMAGPRPGDLSPPNSLISAPPSYSYVLRQMTVRRRPRLMGTFIPSPSFIPQYPPPNYNAAFDIYVDNAIPPPPRIRQFGFAPAPIICPECGFAGMSIAISKVTMCTHLCAMVLCLFCCWVCAPLPYLLNSCKNVYHYCSNCRYFLGMYCPTNTPANMP